MIIALIFVESAKFHLFLSNHFCHHFLPLQFDPGQTEGLDEEEVVKVVRNTWPGIRQVMEERCV